MPGNGRRFAIVLQLAFVGLLVMGRVVTSIVDLTEMPGFDSANASASVATGPGK